MTMRTVCMNGSGQSSRGSLHDAELYFHPAVNVGMDVPSCHLLRRHRHRMLADQLSREGLGDEGTRLLDPVNGDEGAESRPFFLTEQDAVERVEPVERDTRPLGRRSLGLEVLIGGKGPADV